MGDRRDVAVLVHDVIEGRIATLPIVDRAWYDRHGYVLYPEYLHMFCDDDLTHLRGRPAGSSTRAICAFRTAIRAPA